MELQRGRDDDAGMSGMNVAAHAAINFFALRPSRNAPNRFHSK